MKLTGNTILITGGGSGIGRGLAESFHKLGNQVIIAGRRRKALDDTTAVNPGMTSMVFDAAEPGSVQELSARLADEHPNLNVLINNAGIMRIENVEHANLSDAESIVRINLLGPIRLISSLLPLLRKQPHSIVMNVSSGLAFVPLAQTPTYCATKAALHSYTQSLRFQLSGTSTDVLELIPPYVATDLLNGRDDPRAMPLDQFIAETMEILKTQSQAREICVENVKGLRFAAARGVYDSVFQGMNESFAHR